MQIGMLNLGLVELDDGIHEPILYAVEVEREENNYVRLRLLREDQQIRISLRFDWISSERVGLALIRGGE